MDVSALGPDNIGKSGVGGRKLLPDGKGGGSGDAIGKADRGMLAMVAASADPASLDRHLGRGRGQVRCGAGRLRARPAAGAPRASSSTRARASRSAASR
jgi:hypothetical protein